MRRASLLTLCVLAACEGKEAGDPVLVEPPRVGPEDAGEPLPSEPDAGCGVCVAGERRCAAEDRYAECTTGDDGCTRWLELLCPQAEDRCVEGRCGLPGAPCDPPCAAGERCVVGECVAGPACDPPCAAGQACEGGRCVGEACDPACGPGERCLDGDCVIDEGCDPACGAGEVCVAGRCVGDAPCEPACQAGQRCAGGRCVGDGDCPEPCEPGEQRCTDGQHYAVCGEGTPECWRYSDPLPCGQGQSCRDGACTGCPGECRLPGPVCLDDQTRRLCGTDDRGCSVLREEACAGRCVDGECAGGCDECVAGSERCVGGTLQRCGRVEGCLRWNDAGPCEVQCRDQCGPEGERTCHPNGLTTRCIRGRDGCLEEVDLGGCPPGEIDCNNDDAYRVCEVDASGCFHWAAHPCEGGEGCFLAPGACFGLCRDACEPGARECQDGGRYRECVPGFDGCLEWRDRFCQGFEACEDAPALCFGDCDDACQEGSTQCEDRDTFRVCVREPGGCTEWERHPCLEGDCFNTRDACVGECDHECMPDEKRCADDQFYEECDADFNGCRRWSQRFCDNGADCRERPEACFGECDDACTLDRQECVDRDGFRVCVAGPTGCTAWEERPCENDADCFNGRDACFGECQNACVEDEKECLDDDRYRECMRGFNGCTAWQERFCFSADCRATPGACFGDCFNACELEDARCVTGETWQGCALRPDGLCTAWGEAQPCATEESCFFDVAACTGR